jgi:hypothetical protein
LRAAHCSALAIDGAANGAVTPNHACEYPALRIADGSAVSIKLGAVLMAGKMMNGEKP